LRLIDANIAINLFDIEERLVGEGPQKAIFVKHKKRIRSTSPAR